MPLAVVISFAASWLAAQADDLGALDQRFRALYSQGKYAEVATVGERLVTITEQAYGSNAPATAVALDNLAMVCRAQGRYEEALAAYGRVLAIKAVGPEPPDGATALNNLAMMYQALDRYEEAFKAYDRALAIHEPALGPEQRSLAIAWMLLP